MSKVVSVNLHHSHSQTLAGILLGGIQDLYSSFVSDSCFLSPFPVDTIVAIGQLLP